MGVRIQQVTKEIAEVEKLEKPEGALIASVSENSPADKSGIKAGDIILEFDGQKVNTVGKKVIVKIWRNQKLISKKVSLGRLESSEAFKTETGTQTDPSEYTKIEKLKISVRDLNKKDISKRDLPNYTSGVVVMKISEDSPLVFVSEGDIIVELQKKKIISSKQFSNLVKDIIDKGEKTLYLAIYNSNNQRSYITVKLK